MLAKSLEGDILAKQITQQVESEICSLSFPPKLVSLLIGSDQGADSYAKTQKKLCESVGIDFVLKKFPDTVTQEEILKIIRQLNNDKSVTGIMIFVPVPKNINVQTLQSNISAEKDVEGITPTNMGKLFYGDYSIAACTPKAIMLLLRSTGVNLVGKEVVVISRNPILGQPLIIMLLGSEMSPTPTCCHIQTKDLAFHTKRADIVIVAAGKAGLINGDMIKRGAIVIDVGINLEKERIVGDVDFSSVQEVASWITPVPGGVGAVTTAVLLQNTVLLAKKMMLSRKDC